ncbi:hypothetical protein BVC80_659g23 [Macleaya cordata]|uniref:MORF/ORRM1/DAG-like MORF domain-containing protein n=1 Tax=Macleaya cordata TaxID=56857 RepID=A0A200QFH5_MACCD|nr:hypothetical protein BVC80_659g23 [Macleaya cordata]
MAVALLGRALITKTNLASTFSRSFMSSSSISQLPLSVRSFSPLLRLRPLVALTEFRRFPSEVGLRCFSSRPTTSSLNDPSPNWNNRPPKETILLDGCDFEHWLIVMEKPEGEPTRDEIIDSYIQTLANVLGSEEAARKSIYSVSTRHYFAFGCIVSEELSYKIKELPRVRWVLPDSYLDVKNKDYGGEPFIDGQAVPYDPKYHEEWVRNNARANERSRRNDRPRNFDRSRNFERRRENMQNRDFQQRPNPTPNMGGGMPHNPMQNAGPNMAGMPPNPNMQNAGPNMGGMPPNPNMQNAGPNLGGMPPSGNMHPNMGGMPPSGNMQPNMGHMQHNAYPQNNGPNMGGMPPHNPYPQNNGPNMGGMPPHNTYPQNNGPNMGNRDSGYSNNMPNSGGGPYRDVQNGGGMPYQGREAPANRDAYQGRDFPGRDYQ